MAREYDRPIMSSTPAGADVERDVRDDWDEGRGDEVRRVIRANKIQGDRVRNSAGDDLGKIEEIMIDVSRGRIAYAVLSFGGFLGMGNKLFAIPWEALSLNQRDNFFVLNVSKERLEKAPGFDKDNWPDMTDPGWGSDLYSYYGYRPYWER